MKASESVKNYPSSLRMYTNYTVREIKKMCQSIGPRPSGTESERKAQEHLVSEMKTCCDKAATEDFKMSKYAFMAWVPIAGIFAIISMICNFFGVAIVPVVLISFALVMVLFEFLVYKEFLDPVFPKSIACNAVGVRSPKGEVKQRIVFCGHTDSAYEWTFTYYGGKALLFGASIYAVVGLLFVFVIGIISLVMGENAPSWLNILKYVQLAFVPGFIAVLFFANFKRPVMGANDNLTGAVAAVAVTKFLEDNGIELENTEVVAMASGCEEAGLRGARAYTKAHLDELKAIPTAFIGLDTLRDYEDMAIYARDMTGTVKNDPRVCALLKKGAERAGLDLPYESVYLGSSDAAAVTKLGVPAATLAAMNPGPPRYYHTRLDTVEELVPKTVEKCLDICLQSLFIFDEYGLKENYDEVEVDCTPVSPKSK